MLPSYDLVHENKRCVPEGQSISQMDKKPRKEQLRKNGLSHQSKSPLIECRKGYTSLSYQKTPLCS